MPESSFGTGYDFEVTVRSSTQPRDRSRRQSSDGGINLTISETGRGEPSGRSSIYGVDKVGGDAESEEEEEEEWGQAREQAKERGPEALMSRAANIPPYRFIRGKKSRTILKLFQAVDVDSAMYLAGQVSGLKSL